MNAAKRNNSRVVLPGSVFLTVALLLAGGLAVAVGFGLFSFYRLSICGRCAMTQRTRERQLPLLPIAVWTNDQPPQHTRLSQFLTDFAVVDSHEHRWIPVRGGGNGVQCMLGSGRSLHRLSDHEDAIRFLQVLQEKEQPEVFSRWLAFALDYRTADSIPSLLIRINHHPTLEQGWWTERETLEKERVAELARAARYYPER